MDYVLLKFPKFLKLPNAFMQEVAGIYNKKTEG